MAWYDPRDWASTAKDTAEKIGAKGGEVMYDIGDYIGSGGPFKKGEGGGFTGGGEAPKEGSATEDQARKSREELNKIKEQWQQKENELYGALLRQSAETGQAADRELQALIEKSGFLAGSAKKATGAQMWAQGMGRSTVAAERAAGIEETTRQGIAEARTQVGQQKTQIEQNVVEAQMAVSNKRQEILNNLATLEAQGLQDLSYQEEVQRAKMEFNDYINQLEISSKGKMDLASIFGSVAALGGMAAAYKLGSPDKTEPGDNEWS